MTDEDRELIKQLITSIEGLRTALAGADGFHIYHHHSKTPTYSPDSPVSKYWAVDSWIRARQT